MGKCRHAGSAVADWFSRARSNALGGRWHGGVNQKPQTPAHISAQARTRFYSGICTEFRSRRKTGGKRGTKRPRLDQQHPAPRSIFKRPILPSTAVRAARPHADRRAAAAATAAAAPIARSAVSTSSGWSHVSRLSRPRAHRWPRSIKPPLAPPSATAAGPHTHATAPSAARSPATASTSL